eukprot:scaffold105029_cov57-Phaeocystis_antarctica.AAC.2
MRGPLRQIRQPRASTKGRCHSSLTRCSWQQSSRSLSLSWRNRNFTLQSLRVSPSLSELCEVASGGARATLHGPSNAPGPGRPVPRTPRRAGCDERGAGSAA